MYRQTEGIVFHTLRYTDNSLIVKIYTRLFGMQSYIVKGITGSKSKFKKNYFQALTVIDLEVSYRQKSNFQYIKDVRMSRPFQSIPEELGKKSILLFLSEVLYKTIREEEPNPSLFDFISHFLYALDAQEGSYNQFHLYFLVQLSRYLGFSPHGSFSEVTPYFNLKEGYFVSFEPEHDFFLEREGSMYFSGLLNSGFIEMTSIAIPPALRKELLNRLIHYYEFHFQNLPKIQSHLIMQEIFQA